MADPYDDEDVDQREQAAYDQEEAAAQQQLMQPVPGADQTFDFNGQPVTQAIPIVAPVAPQPQQPQQPPQSAPAESFDVTWDTAPQQQQPAPQQQQPAPRAQPQPQPQPQQRSAPALTPYPQVAARANRQQRAEQAAEARFGTIIPSEDTYDVDLKTQPTGGLASVVGLDFSTMGHQISSLAGIGLKQLGASTEYLDHFNEQWQKFNEDLTASLSPDRQAAAGVTVTDPKKLLEVFKEHPGAVLESYLVTGATAIAGGLGAGAAAKLATRTAARLAGVGAAGAARAGQAAGVVGAGVQGGAAGAGARYEDYAHTIDNMTPEEKANSAMYQRFQSQGMDDAGVREQMKRQFPTLQQFGANFAASVGLAAVTPGLRGQMWQRPTRAGNIGIGAVEAGVPGAVGTGASAAIQEQSKVAAGTQPAINWGQVGVEAAIGGGAGGIFGAGTGAFRAGRPREAPPPEPVGPARVDNVTPGGVPPEHTAALNAAGIGRPPEGRVDLAQSPLLLTNPAERPPAPSAGPGGTPLSGDPARLRPDPLTQGPPARYAGGEGIGGTALPPEPGLAAPLRPQLALPPPERQLLLPPPEGVRGPGGPGDFTMGQAPVQPAPMRSPGGAPLGPEPTPASFVRPQPVGPGGIPLRPEPGLAQALPTRPLAAAAGPGGAPLPAEPYRAAPIQRGAPPPGAGPGGTPLGPEPYPSAPVRPPSPMGAGPGGTPLPGEIAPAATARAAAVGPGGAPLRPEPTPAPAPPRPAPIPAGPGGAPLPAEPVRRVPRRVQLPGESPGGTPLPEQQQRAAAPRRLEQAVRGEGFTTQPGRVERRPSEGLSHEELGQRLADLGVSQKVRERLVSRTARAAALDQIEEMRARGREEPAPAPRGAEAREPAPAARPSEGMSHKQLGEALEKLGLSKKEVNQFVNKVQRAAAYDRLVRQEAEAIERVSGTRKGEGEQPTTIRTVMEAGPDETKGHPAGEREDAAWRKLKPERTVSGSYKGAPEWVTKPRHLKQLRNLMKQLIKEGEKGRYWYEDSMKKIMQVTRGNLREAERVTGLIAIYSPQRPVPTNTGFAVKAYGQWRRGEPIRVGSEAQDLKAKQWLDSGQDWGGRKTNNFYLNLMHELITAHPEVLEPGNNRLNLPPDVTAAIKGATVDLWVLRALGHRVDSAGGVTATGSAATKYGFSELEIKRLAGELNASVPVGEQRWLPHQVQAALWSAIKARFELKSVKAATWAESEAAGFAKRNPETGKLEAPSKNGPERQGHMAIWRKHALAADPADVARVIDIARGDFGAALERMAQHITVEAIPSKDLNHPVFNASREARDQFTREAFDLITDEDGNDLVAQKLGVDLGYRTPGSGSYEGRVNPNVVTTLIPEKPAGFFDAVKARQYARAVQYIFRQDAVPIFRADQAHKFGPDFYLVDKDGNRVVDDKGRPLNRFRTQEDAQAAADQRTAAGELTTIRGDKIAHGARLVFKDAFDEASEQRLLTALGRELGDDAGFTKIGDNEAVVVNFRGDDGLPFIAKDRDFRAAVDRIVADTDIGVDHVTHFALEGEYGPVQDWKGGSAPARGLAADAGGSPDFQRYLQDRHAAFGKLLDDWSDPEARLAASQPRDGGGVGPSGRSTLELPQARAPPDQRAARERAAERRAAGVEATPEDLPPPREDRPLDASRAQRDQPTAESPLSRVMKDPRVNDPVRAAIDAGGSLHDGLRAIANDPYTNRRLPHVAAYARTMLRLAPDLELRPSETVRRGAFVSDLDLTTGRRAEHIQVREKSAEVLLHEATHSVAGHYIDSLQPGSREFQVLTTIRDEFRRGAEAHGRLGDEQVAYALSNPHELHSMLRTNPEMHDLMRGIVPTAEYRARMAQLGYPVGPAKSLWQSFVRFIRQALKLPQNVTSLMDHVMRPLDDIAEAGARYNRDLPAPTRDSVVYRRGWEQEPLVARTERELPTFSQVRDSVNEWREGRAGNVSSGFRRGVRQGMPTEQLTGFNRHLFQPSTGGENHLDVLNRAMEGVERVSREYGEQHQAAVTAAIKNLNPESNHVMTEASRLDMNPAHPPNHPLNSHSRATADEFKKVVDDYNKLSAAQKQVVTDTFDLTRQQRVDRGDAAMRGLGKAYLEGVSDAQVETMVRQMRTMAGVDEILANDTNPVARAFGDQWNSNRDFVKAIATEWKRGWINNYVPLHRNGDWVVTYTDPDTGQPGMLSRYTRHEAEVARQKLIDEGAEPSLVLSRERRTPSDIPRLSIVDEFAAKLERKFGPEGRAQADAARELLTKVMLDQSRFAGTMRKRLGVHGADPSKLGEAMSQNFLALKNAMGHLEYGPQYDAGLAAMRRHVGEMGRGANTVKVRGENPTSADVIQAQQVLEEFQRRKPVSEDPNNILLKSVNNATMFTYFKFLASPAQTVMNGIETYMQGIPRIGAQFGLGRATTAMARASAEIMPRQFARGLAGTKDVALRRLDPGEWNSGDQIRDHLIQNSRRNDAAGITALFKRLQDGNLIGYSSYRDLQNMAKGTSGRLRGAVDMATDFVSILHNKMEDANRAVTALAAYDVHLQKHGDRAAAIDYADRILRKAQPNFNLSNKPRFATPQGSFGAWGIPVAQFRQHGMWAYSQMALDIRNAFKGADAATKTEARYALAFTIGMQTVLLGALNWLADPLRYLWGAYDFLSGGKPQNHEHDFRMAAAKIFGTTGGELFSRGLSRGLGYGPDISHRVGMINPLLIPEFKGDFRNPQDVTYAAVTALAGAPAIGAGSEVLTGLANFGAGNITQAVTDLVPKVIRDPLKAYRGETEGQVSRRGNIQQTPEQISTLDTVYQVFGFKSARQGERSEQTGSQRQLLDQIRTSREAATKEAAHALINGSASERRAANEMVVAHNRRYPGSQIDPKDVFAYRKREIERLRDPTLTSITVPKGLQPAVRQAGAFANY